MVRPCPPTMALPSAFASRVTLVGKTPNIFRESLSQTVGITTEKRRVLGTEAFEGYPKVFISPSAPREFKTSIPVLSKNSIVLVFRKIARFARVVACQNASGSGSIYLSHHLYC